MSGRRSSLATNYERGRAFEYRVRDALTEKGAVAVVRSAGSKTKIDLVAMFPIEYGHVYGADLEDMVVWVVQCKRDGNLPAVEREELLRIAELTGVVPYHAHTGPNGRGVVFTLIEEE